MEVFFILWILFAIGVGYMASERDRSGIGWGLLAMLTSPLLAVIFLLIAKDLKAEAAEREREDRRHQEQMAALTRADTLAPAPRRVDEQGWRSPMPAPPSMAAASTAPTAALAPELVAEQLAALSALVDKGRLTLEEFNEQKARLLGKSALAPPAPIAPPGPEAVAAKRRAELAEMLSTPERCVARLRAHGCTVTQPTEHTWEILQPSGVTANARSPEALHSIAMSFATGEMLKA